MRRKRDWGEVIRGRKGKGYCIRAKADAVSERERERKKERERERN
jgi:hypothetical protein